MNELQENDNGSLSAKTPSQSKMSKILLFFFIKKSSCYCFYWNGHMLEYIEKEIPGVTGIFAQGASETSTHNADSSNVSEKILPKEDL